MSTSTHQVAVRAVDQTQGAFASIRSRAASAGAAIGGAMRGAIAAAGAYMGLSKIYSTINELGTLSDQAMRTGATVKDLTSSVTALQVMGLNVSMESMVKSFQYLEKSTGKIGFSAMLDEMDRISKIEDAAKRGNEITRVFGRAGMEMAPLINGGTEAVAAFRQLSELMPGISDSAANSGDAVADAMSVMTSGFKAMWSNAIGYVCGLWGDDFPGGILAGALSATNYIEFFAKKWFNILAGWGAKAGLAMQAVMNFATGGYSWEDAWKEFGEANQMLEDEQGGKLAQLERDRAEYVAKLKQYNADQLSNALGKRVNGPSEAEAAEQAAKQSAKEIRISNALVMGGTNAALRMAANGPQTQKESLKVLKKIEKNTAEAAVTAEDQLHASDDYLAANFS